MVSNTYIRYSLKIDLKLYSTHIIMTSKKKQEIFTESILERSIKIPFKNIGSNLKQHLENSLKNTYESKCVEEGYIENDSITILNYSGGLVNGENVTFTVVFSCKLCLPIENMIVTCSVQNITKAGIKAKLNKYKSSPMIIYISRDHHYDNELFSSLKEDDEISVKIIGHRFELYDDNISVIAELNERKLNKKSKAVK